MGLGPVRIAVHTGRQPHRARYAVASAVLSLKTAARWPGADRATTVILATRLAAARADAEGYRYFSELADAQPGQALPLALAGFFQARLGENVDGALAKLDQAAATDLGLTQYFRGLALAGLPPDRRQPGQAVADLEFVLAVRDQFPPMLLRAAHRRPGWRRCHKSNAPAPETQSGETDGSPPASATHTRWACQAGMQTLSRYA